MADLTLPGSIPGLLRRGSPVFSVWGEESIAAGEYTASGVVLHIPSTADGVVTVRCGWDDEDPDQTCAIDTLHLDLSDPTGFTHALWWLARRLGATEAAIAIGCMWLRLSDGWHLWAGRNWWSAPLSPGIIDPTEALRVAVLAAGGDQ